MNYERKRKVRMTTVFGLKNWSTGAVKTDKEKTTGKEAFSGMLKFQFRTQ